jgi:hypothetical protein
MRGILIFGGSAEQRVGVNELPKAKHDEVISLCGR